MQEHLRILELASRDALPEEIDEQSELPIAVVRELVEAGYLHVIDASSMDGDAYLKPRITLPGREYLRQLQLQREVSAPEKDLIPAVERLRDMLGAVSTGGPRIDTVNTQYRELYATVDEELRKRGITNTNPFPDLSAASSLRNYSILFLNRFERMRLVGLCELWSQQGGPR